MSSLLQKLNLVKPNSLCVFKKIKDLLKFGQSQSELLHGTHLQDLDQYQCHNKEQETLNKVPKTPEEEKEVQANTKKFVSDLDDGIDTYFHQINEVHEGRLNFEPVMERERSKRKHPNETLRSLRISEKIEIVVNKFGALIENFSYLEEKSLTDPTQKIQVNSPEHMEIVNFVSKENLLSEVTFFSNAQLEDIIIKDYLQTIEKVNKMPLYNENALYYHKETADEGLNLHGMRMNDNISNTTSIKVHLNDPYKNFQLLLSKSKDRDYKVKSSKAQSVIKK